MFGNLLTNVVTTAAKAFFTPYTPLHLNREQPAMDDFFMSEIYDEYDDLAPFEIPIDEAATVNYSLRYVLGADADDSDSDSDSEGDSKDSFSVPHNVKNDPLLIVYPDASSTPPSETPSPSAEPQSSGKTSSPASSTTSHGAHQEDEDKATPTTTSNQDATEPESLVDATASDASSKFTSQGTDQEADNIAPPTTSFHQDATEPSNHVDAAASDTSSKSTSQGAHQEADHNAIPIVSSAQDATAQEATKSNKSMDAAASDATSQGAHQEVDSDALPTVSSSQDAPTQDNPVQEATAPDVLAQEATAQVATTQEAAAQDPTTQNATKPNDPTDIAASSTPPKTSSPEVSSTPPSSSSPEGQAKAPMKTEQQLRLEARQLKAAERLHDRAMKKLLAYQNLRAEADTQIRKKDAEVRKVIMEKVNETLQKKLFRMRIKIMKAPNAKRSLTGLPNPLPALKTDYFAVTPTPADKSSNLTASTTIAAPTSPPKDDSPATAATDSSQYEDNNSAIAAPTSSPEDNSPTTAEFRAFLSKDNGTVLATPTQLGRDSSPVAASKASPPKEDGALTPESESPQPTTTSSSLKRSRDSDDEDDLAEEPSAKHQKLEEHDSKENDAPSPLEPTTSTPPSLKRTRDSEEEDQVAEEPSPKKAKLEDQDSEEKKTAADEQTDISNENANEKADNTEATPAAVEKKTTPSPEPEPKYVIYHNTGSQTYKDVGDAASFRRIYGRTPEIIRNAEIGSGARGRYTVDSIGKEDPTQLRYGKAYLKRATSSSTSSGTSTSESTYQTMDFSDADPALARARVRADITCHKLRKAATGQGVVVSIKKDALIAHSEGIKPRAKVHGDGTVDYDGDVDVASLFPNVAFDFEPLLFHDFPVETVDLTPDSPSAPSSCAEYGNVLGRRQEEAYSGCPAAEFGVRQAAVREQQKKRKAATAGASGKERDPKRARLEEPAVVAKEEEEKVAPSPAITTTTTTTTPASAPKRKATTDPAAAKAAPQSESTLTVKAPSGGARFTAANPRFPRRDRVESAAAAAPPAEVEPKVAAPAAAEKTPARAPPKRGRSSAKSRGVYVPPGRRDR